MRKSQQQASRKRSARISRKQAENRKLRRWWKAMIVDPLMRCDSNNRTNRQIRLRAVTNRKTPPAIYLRNRPDWTRARQMGMPATTTAMEQELGTILQRHRDWPPPDAYLLKPDRYLPAQQEQEKFRLMPHLIADMMRQMGVPLEVLQQQKQLAATKEVIRQLATTDPEQALLDRLTLGTSVLIEPDPKTPQQ